MMEHTKVVSCLLLYEDYVWVSLGNAMKAKQSKAKVVSTGGDNLKLNLEAQIPRKCVLDGCKANGTGWRASGRLHTPRVCRDQGLQEPSPWLQPRCGSATWHCHRAGLDCPGQPAWGARPWPAPPAACQPQRCGEPLLRVVLTRDPPHWVAARASLHRHPPLARPKVPVDHHCPENGRSRWHWRLGCCPDPCTAPPARDAAEQ
jgi:hypothetical protein